MSRSVWNKNGWYYNDTFDRWDYFNFTQDPVISLDADYVFYGNVNDIQSHLTSINIPWLPAQAFQ